MLIRRVARPLLSAVFIGQGIETLRNPSVTLEATEPTVAALRNLPEPYGDKIPSNPETAARINAAVQVSGGLLLATGKLPRIASAALAVTVIIFGAVAGPPVGAIAGGCAALGQLGFWVLLPLWARRQAPSPAS